MLRFILNPRKTIIPGFCLALVATIASAGDPILTGPTVALLDPENADFKTSEGVPECTSFAVMRGDMAASSSSMMVKMVSGCVVPYQWHTPNEELVFLKGTIEAQLLGEDPVLLKDGGYILLPSHRPHRFRCVSEEDCIMFLVADTAFDIHFVDQSGASISQEDAMLETNRISSEDW